MRKELEKRLKKQRYDLENVEKEIIALNTKKLAIEAVICELDSLLKTLPKENGEPEAEKQLRNGTDVYKARIVLRAHGKPLYIDDIIGSMGELITKDRRRSLAGQIAAYVRAGQIFTRPEPNTFGLREFANKESETPGFSSFVKEEIDSLPLDSDTPF